MTEQRENWMHFTLCMHVIRISAAHRLHVLHLRPQVCNLSRLHLSRIHLSRLHLFLLHRMVRPVSYWAQWKLGWMRKGLGMRNCSKRLHFWNTSSRRRRHKPPSHLPQLNQQEANLPRYSWRKPWNAWKRWRCCCNNSLSPCSGQDLRHRLHQPQPSQSHAQLLKSQTCLRMGLNRVQMMNLKMRPPWELPAVQLHLCMIDIFVWPKTCIPTLSL